MAASPPGSERAARLALLVMGVSGTGKSTLAEALAQALGLAWVDGDDLHAPASVEKMRRGEALDDADRGPWLDRIGARLADAAEHPDGLVVACSALRRAYRERLRSACPGLRFIFLDGDAALIHQRMRARRGHFMPPGLLQSQLATLERPGPDEPDVHRVDILASPATLLAQALDALGRPAAR